MQKPLVLNLILSKLFNNKEREYLKTKISRIKPIVDSKCPESFYYLQNKFSKTQKNNWNCTKIDINTNNFKKIRFNQKPKKNKLKTLYGFDYNLAEEQIKGGNKKDENKINLTEEDIKQSINNVQEEEKLIEDKIDKEVQNKGRNAGAIIRGAGEIGGVIIKALPTAAVEGAQVATRFAVNGLLKAASWAIFPITCSAFGAWSCVNIHKDCIKILDIFDKAFTPLRYKTLYAYVLSFELALEYLDQIGNKIIEDDKLENS